MDLSGITMDALMPTTPAGDPVEGDGDDSIMSDLPSKDDGIVLAQPAANPPVLTSNLPIEVLVMENPSAKDKGDGTSKDAPAT